MPETTQDPHQQKFTAEQRSRRHLLKVVGYSSPAILGLMLTGDRAWASSKDKDKDSCLPQPCAPNSCLPHPCSPDNCMPNPCNPSPSCNPNTCAPNASSGYGGGFSSGSKDSGGKDY